ncbi:hypothetical protein PIB30_092312 [Stylosanthes scabra]|uniref:Ubiquitin-like protease family profile domain-containing protein n=1 Tax=Stylosanthes scabra TaxID=79078 RepID=A0ABU6UYE7_9FABA|nr:hypothetical protein [Stylosanthes scabra]
MAIHGCYYALMIIYFHETQFGERSRDPAAQPPWLAYWTGETLKKRLKLEKKQDAGLLKTGKLRVEKEQLKKKNTEMVLSSESQSSSSTDGEGDSESESQQQERESTRKEDRRVTSPSSSDSEDNVSKEPPQQERRMKQKNDQAVVGSNAPFNPTQQSAAIDGLPQSDDSTLVDALKTIKNIRKRKKQQTENINTKKRIVQGIEGGEKMQDVRRPASEAANGSDRTRMFDSFETVSLGREDSDNVVVEGPSIMPSQTEKRPFQPDQPSKPQGVEVDDPGHILPLQLEQPSTPQYNEVEDPVPINMKIPLKTQEQCSLTLRPWLQPEAGTSTAVQSPEAVITNMLLGMNREESDNQEQQLGDQCKTPDPLQQQYQNAPTKQDLEERCATWATVENNNKYETIFQLRGPRTIEAMRYNFLTMAPATCIDIQMVSLMCHVLNREELPRFERDVYCVPPEILTRIDKLNHIVSCLLLLFSLLQYKEFYIVDSVYGITPNQQRSKLHRFACNILNQLRVWAGAQSILKKGTISLQLRCVEVPKQPNPMDCGVYVMKWMELLDAATLSGCYEFKV